MLWLSFSYISWVDPQPLVLSFLPAALLKRGSPAEHLARCQLTGWRSPPENGEQVRVASQPFSEGIEVLNRGIATRAFKQTFNLAGYITGTTLEHGLVIVDLKREVPEALEPQQKSISPSTSRSASPSLRTTNLRRLVRL